MLTSSIIRQLKVTLGLVTVAFLLTNFLCAIDYETVSLLESWRIATTRNELLLMTGLVSAVLVAGYFGIEMVKRGSAYFNRT